MAAKQGYCKEVNIKADLPTADLAVKRVGYNIQNGKVWGCGCANADRLLGFGE